MLSRIPVEPFDTVDGKGRVIPNINVMDGATGAIRAIFVAPIIFPMSKK